MTFLSKQLVKHKETGNILLVKERVLARKEFPAGYICSPVDNRYSSQKYLDDELEAMPERKRGAPFDFKTEIMPRAQGAIPWENVEPADLTWLCSNIAACAGWAAYSGIAWVQKPGADRSAWARIFLSQTQGGGYTGEAHALVWESGTGRGPSMPSAWKLSICKHEVIDTSTPEGRRRGDHRAHCSKCGLDLSVDSSD